MIIAIIAKMFFAVCTVSGGLLPDINQQSIITVNMEDHFENNLVQMNIIMMYTFIEMTTPQGIMIGVDKAKRFLAIIAKTLEVHTGIKLCRL